MIKFKNKKNLRLIATLLLVVISFSLINLIFIIRDKDKISLYIDDKPVRLKIKPIKKNNKIYFPLVEVVKALGYEAELDFKNYIFEFISEDRHIKYQHGKTYGYVNNKFTHFTRPTIFNNGLVFASLDTIQKMTSTYSKWTLEKDKLYLERPPEINFIDPESDFYLSTYNKSHQILGKIVKDKLLISGSIDDGFSWRLDNLLEDRRFNMKKDLIVDNVFETSLEIKKNNIFNDYIVNANRKNSLFDHNTFMNIIPRYDFEVFSTDELEHEKISNQYIDNYIFANPTNYNDNLRLYNDHSLNHPKNFLSLDFIKDHDELNEIKSLALYITKDEDNDYDRAFAIHNWIVDNLSYDYEKYYSGDWSGQDPYLALKEKKTLCEGFAFLNMALCRSINIPSKIVFGFAANQNVSKKELEHNKYGHAWNEIFVDNRWIIVDTTWDTKSTYNNGMFLKNINSFLHFDISLKQLSNTHLIELYPIY